MTNNSKYKVVVRIKGPLTEKRSGIQHSKVDTSLEVDDDLRLEEQRVEVRENHVVEFLYIDYYFVFLFALKI